MKLDAGSRTRILVDVSVEIDPEGTDVELRVDDDWYPATWLGDAVHTAATSNSREKWTQTARTDGYFAGPDADDDGAVVLDSDASHPLEVRVTSGSDILTKNLPALVLVV